MLLKNHYDYPIIEDVHGEFVTPRTENQLKLVQAIDDNDIIFVSGPPGTGKSMISIAKAIQLYQDDKKGYHKIVLSRPIVATEELGFLPGSMEDKIHPYLLPLYDYLKLFVKKNSGRKARKTARKTGVKPLNDDEFPDYIEIAPLAYLRGRTLDNSLIILDESQNVTQSQMKLLLTRIGKNSKIILTGDERQSDLHRNVVQGFTDAIDRLITKKKINRIVEVKMTNDDILRNGIIREICEAYES